MRHEVCSCFSVLAQKYHEVTFTQPIHRSFQMYFHFSIKVLDPFRDIVARKKRPINKRSLFETGILPAEQGLYVHVIAFASIPLLLPKLLSHPSIVPSLTRKSRPRHHLSWRRDHRWTSACAFPMSKDYGVK